MRKPGVFIEGSLPVEEFDLPPEVLPDLLEVDLDDLDSILGFIRRFGFLSGPEDPIREGDPEQGLAAHLATATHDTPITGLYEGVAIEGQRDFVMYAGALQTAHLLRQELFHPQFSLARIRCAWPKYATRPQPPSTKGQAADMLKHILDAGLSDFAFDVSLQPDRLSVAATPRASLFGLLMVELVDSIQNDLPYRRCVRCQRWFHRQEGRSRKNAFSRRDSIYCSKACARAQAQAAYYRKHHSKEGG